MHSGSHALAFAYLESASGIHVYEESVSLESSIFGVGATRLADHMAQKLCVHRSFAKQFQQVDCYGSALVGEFMVAFLLVFTVLRTESRMKAFGFHEEF